VTSILILDYLGGNAIVSDVGPFIAGQIIECKLGEGVCRPFIPEKANARLAAQGSNTSPERRDSHGGIHTHTHRRNEYDLIKVPPEDSPVHNLSMNISMLVNAARDYFAVSSAQIYEIIKKRNHEVLNLTQGYFLIVFLVAALVMVASSFLFEHKNNFYCNAYLPIIWTSGQLLCAITLGRLWRIDAVISPLLIKTLRQKKSFTRSMIESSMSDVGLKIKPRQQDSKICAGRLALGT
jgi:hypothetical protein